MLVHAHDSARETGGKRRSSGFWAVVFDGPSHLLASGALTAALAHVLVSVPSREWGECKGASDTEVYLRGKLQNWKGRESRQLRDGNV